jgi:hypothetical protein
MADAAAIATAAKDATRIARTRIVVSYLKRLAGGRGPKGRPRRGIARQILADDAGGVKPQGRDDACRRPTSNMCPLTLKGPIVTT